jgi:hypothetical protein
MGTPATAMAIYLRGAFLVLGSLWFLALAISRGYTFYGALNAELTRKNNNRWLLERCNEPDFYFNIRGHTDLCAEVVSNGKSNVFLSALYTVVTTTHICGASPCVEVVASMVKVLGWNVVWVGVLALVCGPNIMYSLVRRTMMSGVSGMQHHPPSAGYRYSSIEDTYDIDPPNVYRLANHGQSARSVPPPKPPYFTLCGTNYFSRLRHLPLEIGRV